MNSAYLVGTGIEVEKICLLQLMQKAEILASPMQFWAPWDFTSLDRVWSDLAVGCGSFIHSMRESEAWVSEGLPVNLLMMELQKKTEHGISWIRRLPSFISVKVTFQESVFSKFHRPSIYHQ